MSLNSTFFKSARLSFRPLCQADLELIYEVYSDHEAMRFRGSAAMSSMADAQQMIDEQAVLSPGDSKLRLAIRTSDHDRLIGTLLIKHTLHVTESYEIGFSFGKDYWGKGYGQETLEAIEEELWKKSGVRYIKAWCMKKNLPSVHIFKKAGYVEHVQSVYPNSRLLVKERIKNKHYFS